eukprot:CAMPEP_0198270168 /NCGR_PEP_ID=MMETSP1447-20131203/44047_1 /TAXON_ID=420782 /ORGANISM="Chaetoceros dichaeta, Strain CCMP1751" /LENGTH=58 /DNA_ID=CAMNT_0043962057 /DNA_START=58 /DNA_END=231 /DNA_ORIENTATION=-
MYGKYQNPGSNLVPTVDKELREFKEFIEKQDGNGPFTFVDVKTNPPTYLNRDYVWRVK